MKEQPIPRVTQDDVHRLVLRDFASDRCADVFAVLAQFEVDLSQLQVKAVSRVQAAALKLANCDFNQLIAETEIARMDYRDTLVAAEYPRYMREIRNDQVSETTKSEVVESDWRQYREWFEKL